MVGIMEHYRCMKLFGKDGKIVIEAYKMLKPLFGPNRTLENWRTDPVQKEYNLKWT